jgi:Raf kinase inhibitor-like YbhB/YbcL family protein
VKKILLLSVFFLINGFSLFALDIKSSAFENGGYLPDRYTCDGANISAPLEFSNVPDKVKSLALVCEDPDAPMGVWVHWIVYNIAPATLKLEEAIAKDTVLLDGAQQGINDFGETGYGGACPPEGKAHRYVFKLYALDVMLDSAMQKPAKKDIEKAMTGHILAEAKITGLYQKKILTNVIVKGEENGKD